MSRGRSASDSYCRKCGGPCRYVEPQGARRGRPSTVRIVAPPGSKELAIRAYPQLLSFATAQLAKRGLSRDLAKDLVQAAWVRWLWTQPKGVQRAEGLIRQYIKDAVMELWRRQRGDERHGPVDVLDSWSKHYDTTEPHDPQERLAQRERAFQRAVWGDSGESETQRATTYDSAAFGRYSDATWDSRPKNSA